MKTLCRDKRPVRRGVRGGFTIVELLVVITIIAILMGLLLPAVNAAREAMRRLSCQNNLYQIGDAAQQHLAKQGYFPSGGWGYMWSGDPDMGFGAKQPGGWLYSLLPYMGHDNIHDVAKGLDASKKRTALGQMRSSVVASFICPTRRRTIGYPPSEASWNADPPSTFAKTDYAANGGNAAVDLYTGPSDTNCVKTYPNCSGLNSFSPSFDGPVGLRSETPAAQITDGMSQTIFAGEKYLSVQFYSTGNCCADNNSAYEGYDWDLNRWVPDMNGNGADRFPMQDAMRGEDCTLRFGSAHSSGFNVVLCDGAARHLSYAIDHAVFGRLGIRNDISKGGASVDVSRL